MCAFVCVYRRMGWGLIEHGSNNQIHAFLFSNEEKLIYQTIKYASTAGVWSKDVKNKIANISSAAFEKIIKKLSSMDLIKSFKSVSSKHKKMYILFELGKAKL
jgi:hypothetical protein